MSPGGAGLLAGAMAGTAVLLALQRSSAARLRLDDALRPAARAVTARPGGPAAPSPSSGPCSAPSRAPSSGPAPPGDPRPDRRARAASVVAAGAVLLLVGGLPGAVAAAALLLLGPRLLGRLEPGAVRREREEVDAALPLALDLLAACLAGGAPLSHAAAAVADAVPGPVGRRLQRVAAALALGSPAEEAWRCLLPEAASAGPDPGAAGVAVRALVRASTGGAPVAAAVARVAADARAQARARAEQAARRAGVLVVLPLGLCFLPAFVLLGVVPVVLGLAGPLLRSLG